MAGVVFLFTLFLMNVLIVVIEKGNKCWIEKKFWISLLFILFLMGITIYGYSQSPEMHFF